MHFFVIILAVVLLADISWILAARRLARAVPGRGAWISLNVLFAGSQLAGLLLLIVGRGMHADWDHHLPRFAISAVLIWHLLGVPLMLVAGLACLGWALGRFIAGRRSAAGTGGPVGGAALSRRHFLGMTALGAPTLFTVGLSGVAQAQLDSFRVRRLVLPVPGLPPDLDGLTIAHVSDMHLGRLTTAPVLRRMVGTVNDLRADLVLQTGDLINDELSALPEGLALAGAMQGRYGSCLIEGNHDLIENRTVFEARARESSVPFLLNEARTLSIRGCPVQLLGLRWDSSGVEDRDAVIAGSVRKVTALREPGAFPILMAHHPHAFDAAAAAGIPLTLSGHTHGGQLMLGDGVGAGPLFYRYWSGLYRRGSSQLVVSNGVGNWFPLRINAPAEIVHLTLRTAG